MTRAEIRDRLSWLRAEMKKADVTAVLISSPANRRYFSGLLAEDPTLDESSGCLVITGRSQFLLTDTRYTEAARAQAPDFKIICYRQGLAEELKRLPALKRAQSLYFEPDFLTVASFNNLRQALKPRELLPLPFKPAEARSVKSPGEIKLISQALAITERALSNLWPRLIPGLTERQAAHFLENEFRRLGAEGPAFETIVASGPNGALPHAEPGARKLREGDLVIVDCGARYKGYCADITRTMMIGQPKKWQREIYRVVRQAQLKAIESIRAGVTGRQVDQAARGHITASGYGDFFGHGLGHGVGLVVHEAPSLSPRYDQPLKAGQVVTVEPGIYLPGRGGVRLEELVLVTENGSRLLNHNRDFYQW